MEKEYDIILYGSNGYTAQYIIGYLEHTDLKIGLAARNIVNIIDSDLPKIECSLEDVVKKTEILINCVGPYYESGDIIINSCLDNMTHYIDLCGEVHYMKDVINKYHEKALKKKLFIIQGCGFDSVLSDLGTEYLKKSFDSEIEIRNIIEINNLMINIGTWKSLIESLGCYKKNNIKRNSSTKTVKEYFYDENFKGYVTKFKGTDHFMVSTTQKIMKTCNLPTSKFSVYIKIGSLYNLFMYYIYITILVILSKYGFGKNILTRFYSFFSSNFVQKSPSKEIVKKGSFKMTFEGVGIKNGENISKKLFITGPDPAYTTTGICISHCALILHDMLRKRKLKENVLNLQGGVLTPGFVFRDSNFIDKIRSHGILIELSTN